MKLTNLSKMMMYIILMTSTTMAISSTNMLMMWLCLELNLFSFTPLLLKNSLNNETEASLFYFLAQTLGSTMFLLSNTMMLMTHILVEWNKMILMMSMIMKLGAAPCHHWYPMTMEMISWTNCFILSTWQKLAPLFILMYWMMSNTKKSMLIMLLVSSMNALTGGLLGLNQSSLKKIMAYSSITHMGWMLSSHSMNAPYLSITYLFMYSLVTFPLFILFNAMNKDKVYDLWHKHSPPKHLMIMTSMMLLSLAGMPPLAGFIPKLLILNKLVNNSTMLSAPLITGSLMNLFFYTNISLNMLMSSQQAQMKNKKPSMTSINITIALNSLSLFITTM